MVVERAGESTYGRRGRAIGFPDRGTMSPDVRCA